MRPSRRTHELFAFDFAGDRDKPSYQPDEGIVVRMDLFFLFKSHPDAGVDQEDAEHDHDPVEANQGRAAGDKNGAENDGAQHSVEQHAVLVFRRDAEVAEDQREDEHVVDGKGFFHRIARQKLERYAVRRFRAEPRVREEIQRHRKAKRKSDPGGRPDGGALHRHGLLAAVQEQVDTEQHYDRSGKEKVEPPVFGERKERRHELDTSGPVLGSRRHRGPKTKKTCRVNAAEGLNPKSRNSPPMDRTASRCETIVLTTHRTPQGSGLLSFTGSRNTAPVSE